MTESNKQRDELAAEAVAISEHDLSTSAGGRSYVAEFFAKRLRRHDFGRYINERLAADFACALAQYLRDREAAPQPAQADAREEAYVAKRMAETLATVYATIVGDDQVDENDGLNAIKRCERAAQVLRLEVELYRGQADARVGLTDRFIAEFGHRLATLLKIDAFDIADRDAQILALLQGTNQ